VQGERLAPDGRSPRARLRALSRGADAAVLRAAPRTDPLPRSGRLEHAALFGHGLWALLEYLLHDYLHYVVISWPFAVLNAYICYRVFVFRSKDSVWRELPRFSLVYLVTLCAGLLALPVLLRTLPINIYVIQAGYTAIVVVLSYLSHKFFGFGGNRRRSVVPDGKRLD
jgi:putative flippase GtrA